MFSGCVAMPHKAKIGASYDVVADVLYLYLSEGQYTLNREEDGLILRYDERTNAPVGATIVDFKEYWLPKRKALTIRLSRFFGVPLAEAQRAIKSVTENYA